MPLRTQHDGKGDEYSNLAATHETGEMITRQEFKDEANLNILLKRFGVQVRTDGQYGSEIDYAIDLQTALSAIDQARKANYNVPPELAEKYPSWLSVLGAAETGEYQRDLKELGEQKAKEAKLADLEARLAAASATPKL
jgi:hypothetical protein